MMAYLKMDAEDGLLSPEDKQRAQGMLGKAGKGMQMAAGEPGMEPMEGEAMRPEQPQPQPLPEAPRWKPLG